MDDFPPILAKSAEFYLVTESEDRWHRSLVLDVVPEMKDGWPKEALYIAPCPVEADYPHEPVWDVDQFDTKTSSGLIVVSVRNPSQPETIFDLLDRLHVITSGESPANLRLTAVFWKDNALPIRLWQEDE